MVRHRFALLVLVPATMYATHSLRGVVPWTTLHCSRVAAFMSIGDVLSPLLDWSCSRLCMEEGMHINGA
jgi:hypothetical protein